MYIIKYNKININRKIYLSHFVRIIASFSRGWPKLQITSCGTKSSLMIHVVNYNYESLIKPVFRPLSLQFSLVCRVIPNKKSTRVHYKINK